MATRLKVGPKVPKADKASDVHIPSHRQKLTLLINELNKVFWIEKTLLT